MQGNKKVSTNRACANTGPYIPTVGERRVRRLKRIREKAGAQAALKPRQTLADVFRVPKERPKERSTANRVKGIVYKVKCNSW